MWRRSTCGLRCESWLSPGSGSDGFVSVEANTRLRRVCDSCEMPYLSSDLSAKLGRIHPALAPRQDPMLCRRFLCAVTAVVLLTAACKGQSVQDPADLFPPDSLLYFEVVKPADIAHQVAGALKGTILEDMASYMLKWSDKDEFRFERLIALPSLFVSPEMISEFGRMQSGAFAITGVTPKQEPNFVFIAMPGQSNLPGFVLRAYLIGSDARLAMQVEGVSIYGDRPRRFGGVAAAVPNAPVPAAPA